VAEHQALEGVLPVMIPGCGKTGGRWRAGWWLCLLAAGFIGGCASAGTAQPAPVAGDKTQAAESVQGAEKPAPAKAVAGKPVRKKKRTGRKGRKSTQGQKPTSQPLPIPTEFATSYDADEQMAIFGSYSFYAPFEYRERNDPEKPVLGYSFGPQKKFAVFYALFRKEGHYWVADLNTGKTHIADRGLGEGARMRWHGPSWFSITMYGYTSLYLAEFPTEFEGAGNMVFASEEESFYLTVVGAAENFLELRLMSKEKKRAPFYIKTEHYREIVSARMEELKLHLLIRTDGGMVREVIQLQATAFRLPPRTEDVDVSELAVKPGQR